MMIIDPSPYQILIANKLLLQPYVWNRFLIKMSKKCSWKFIQNLKKVILRGYVDNFYKTLNKNEVF